MPAPSNPVPGSQEALLGGEGFAAPPSCVVGSTEDTYCVNEEHTDVYVKHLDAAGVPNEYVRGPFGEHGFQVSECCLLLLSGPPLSFPCSLFPSLAPSCGFQLMGGWTPKCIEWLRSRGFGKAAAASGKRGGKQQATN